MYSLRITEHGKKKATLKDQKATKVNKVFKVNADVMEHKVYQVVMAEMELQDVTDAMAEMEKMY
nr:hypothetical protein [Granulicatella elegans]